MHFQNRHSKYVLAKYGKTAIFVTVYFTFRHKMCVRARGSENLCVRDEDKEPRASNSFVTWWVVLYRSFKKPLYEDR